MRRHAWAVVVAIACAWAAACGGEAPPEAACRTAPPEGPEPNALVQTAMRNVRFHATEHVLYDIEELRGELVPADPRRPPNTEVPSSYRIRLAAARLSVPDDSIAAGFRDVLAGTGAPVEGLRAETKDGRLHLRGRIPPGIPFSVTATVEVTDDGRLRVRATRIEALGAGVRALSEATGLDLRRLMGSHADRGVKVDGNDLFLDPGKAFPPPHLEGPLEEVELRDGALALRFGRSAALSDAGARDLPDPGGAHFIQHHGGVLATGAIVAHGADQRLLDADPSDPFDYSQPLFSTVQLPRARIRVGPGGLPATLLVPDLDEATAVR